MELTKEEQEQIIAGAEKKRRLAGIIGIAKKAGKLIIGTELVTGGIRSGAPHKCAAAVFLACDAAANSEKRIRNCCSYYEVPMETLQLTAEELARAVGKDAPLVTVGVLDPGLAEAISERNR